MTRRAAGLLVLAAAIAVGAIAWWLLRSRPAPVVPVAPEAAPEAGASTAVAAEPWPVALYFPDSTDHLAREERTLAVANEPRARVAAIVTALLGGEPQAPRLAPFPAGVTLGSVFVAGDGVAYVDLRGADGADPPASGSTVERLRIASIVHSILHNVSEVSRVVLLWNGTQRPSLSGHVDTGRPLAIDPELEP